MSSESNPGVVSFFFAGAAILTFIGVRYARAGRRPFRSFGTGLVLYAIAFLVWGLLVATRPADLEPWATVGIVPFAAAHFAFLDASMWDWGRRNRRIILVAALGYLVVVAVARFALFPSTAGFSDRGYVYFNAAPQVLLLYVGAFVGAILPALHVVSSMLRSRPFAALTRILFNVVILGGIVLLTSYDDDLQYLNGLLMGGGLIGLLAVYLRWDPAG